MKTTDVTLNCTDPTSPQQHDLLLAHVAPKGNGIGDVTLFTGTAEIRLPFVRADQLEKIVRALRQG